MIEVPVTSAFVLSHTGPEVYRGTAARAFLNSLDLSAADSLLVQFQDTWEEECVEILNRKYGVQKYSHGYLRKNPSAQVIQLGGGLDPLTIDLAECHPKARIFDVDMANMPLKAEINKKIGGPEISFLTANLADVPSLTEVLSNAGWQPDAPTLLISEGISYYVPKEVYRITLSALRTSGGCLVFEYALPDEYLVGTPKADIIEDFFNRFSALLDLPFTMQRYSDSEVKDLAESMNGEVEEIVTQHQLEFSRTGRNEMRPDPTMGAIRVASIRFP
jgi:O-methyltransferase involved in polyketide biosynthesis